MKHKFHNSLSFFWREREKKIFYNLNEWRTVQFYFFLQSSHYTLPLRTLFYCKTAISHLSSFFEIERFIQSKSCSKTYSSCLSKKKRSEPKCKSEKTELKVVMLKRTRCNGVDASENFQYNTINHNKLLVDTCTSIRNLYYNCFTCKCMVYYDYRQTAV